jgi:DNA processing protein
MVNEQEALVVLNHIPLLGSVKIRKLLNQFESALNVLRADNADLAYVPGIGRSIAESIASWEKLDGWKKDLELIKKHHIHLIGWKDRDYPSELKQIDDPPHLLYVSGTLVEEDRQAVAIIGTRNCTAGSAEIAHSLASDLSKMNLTVVSGLAKGIDTAVHRGALQTGRTIAVIGSGLCRIYPKENIPLCYLIQQRGAVISEYPMNTPPYRSHFPRRNRIVSGLSLGIVLIEAPMQSGSMITMEIGLAQGRKLFSLPGREDMSIWGGNHHLLRTGRAKLANCAEEIAKECKKNS